MRIFLFILPLLLFAGDFKESDIEGYWLTSEKDGKFHIYKKEGKYFGKLVWGKNPGKKDENNPDPKLRDREVVGLEILTGFEWDEDEWVDGEIYNPRNGKTYSCLMWLDDMNTLQVKGYIGFSLIGQQKTWTRTTKD